MDIRQSSQFALFMQDIGWSIETIGHTKIYLRKFPIIGQFVKIPRPNRLIEPEAIHSFIKQYRVFHMKISPNLSTLDSEYGVYKKQLLDAGFSIDSEPFNSTTTITIDLKQSEDILFSHFIEAKRRAVRRALKNDIMAKETDDMKAFIEIRKKQYAPLGFLMTKEMHAVWNNFYPDRATLLLAYHNRLPVAGILLLFYERVAYYWYASALPVGKKLFAPTLLVWEALKISKKRGCKMFDFEGIADDRFPKASKPWQGFTKFKEGFGGKMITLAENMQRISLPF